MATLIDGIAYIPALNGTLINSHDCTAAICSLEYAELQYLPVLAGKLAYLSIFAIFLVIQALLLSLHGTWGFSIGMICGLLLEVVGYAARVMLHKNDFSFGNFVMYLVCLTIGPAFFSASIYLCLSRVVIAFGQGIARFSARTYSMIFICCDVLSLILQAAGGAITASATTGSAAQTSGVNIMIAGLSTQVVSLIVFMVLGVDFIVAARRAQAHQLNRSFASLRFKRLFRAFPFALIFGTITIFIRSCFRVAELKNGFRGSLANNQAMFMIFEGPMVMLAVLALTVLHPGIAFGGRQYWRDANWSWKGRSSQDQIELQKA